MYARIRSVRGDKDLTQTEIAKVLGCSQRIYSNYERGDVDIPTTILIKLAKVHNVSADYLLNLTNVNTPYPEKGQQGKMEYFKLVRLKFHYSFFNLTLFPGMQR